MHSGKTITQFTLDFFMICNFDISCNPFTIVGCQKWCFHFMDANIHFENTSVIHPIE